jgi:hypothetical protein
MEAMGASISVSVSISQRFLLRIIVVTDKSKRNTALRLPCLNGTRCVEQITCLYVSQQIYNADVSLLPVGLRYWFGSVDPQVEANPEQWENYWPVGWSAAFLPFSLTEVFFTDFPVRAFRIKIPLIQDLLRLGYAVHYADADVAFGPYPIVKSLHALARESRADIVAQDEGLNIKFVVPLLHPIVVCAKMTQEHFRPLS